LRELSRRLDSLTGRSGADREGSYEADLGALLLQTARVIVLVLDVDHRVVYFNDYFSTLLGWELSELEGRDWVLACVPSGHHGAVTRRFEAAIDGDATIANVNPVSTKSGEALTIEWYDRTLRHVDGRVVGLLAIGHDVTARERAVTRLDGMGRELAAKLQEREARIEEIQSLVQLGSWELDLEQDHLSWSAEVFRIFELEPREFEPSYEAFLNAIHPDDRTLVDEAYRQSVHSREPYLVRHRLKMADGRVKHVVERGGTRYDADGRPVRSYGSIQDVTTLETAQRRIESQLAEKEVLLREIHHRVKNNLQVISSLLYFQAAEAKDDEVRTLFEESRTRVAAMSLVHETLYESADLGRVDFEAYVQKLASGLSASLSSPARRVAIETRVSVPPIEIHQAIPCGLIGSELISNAFKYAFPDRDEGRIVVGLSAVDAERLELRVTDDGVGMDPSSLDSPSTLGLRLVKTLVEQLEGELHLESGDGADFRIRFPRRT
jgi:PAS domain S-box-containing protein